MTPTIPTGPDPKQLRAVYTFGIFSMALIDVFVFLIPIYAGITLGMSDTEIGTLVGARSFFSLFLSIHGGALMDRFGVRRVTLIFVGIVVVCAPLFPLMTSFYGLLILQMFSGFAISIGWSGAQTLIARVAEGDAEYIGRFSSFARIGTTIAPVIAGFLFDLGGAWLAYGFGALWAAFAFGSLWIAPEPDIATAHASIHPDERGAKQEIEPFRLADALPRLSDYTASIAMFAIPAVAFTAVAMLVRNSSYGIQTSVYVTYVQEIGFTATMIGLLFAAIELTAGVGSWFSGRVMRRFEATRVLVLTTVVTICLVCATPLLGGLTSAFWAIFAILVIAQMLRGATQGISQPILFAVQAKSVGRHQQGAVVGLRQTMNRLGGITIPPLIGFLSDTYGREQSFYVMGAILLAVCAGLALYARQVPRISG
ncbi:MAG: MFS transporter [Proteobacteria bacterium]|nr:MFS transporter [Pseudomonadota bacterium]